MGDTSVTMGNGNGPSGGMGGPGSTDNGQGGMGQGPNGPVGNAPGSVTGPQMGQAVTGLINGEDMKVGAELFISSYEKSNHFSQNRRPQNAQV